MFNEEPVRKDSILLWSLILCKISPVFFESKNDNGNFINFIKKSVRIAILIRELICKTTQLLIKSITSLPATKASWPNKTKEINLVLEVLIPTSIILRVRKGTNKERNVDKNSPIISCAEYFL